ncbi:MAG: sporulation initiation factor Spo0A C-terminal domain-containing protein [Firmicutes bacterium]|nr:sporulation initiation factor Spo0A C-terminal domain-containing protein [Bacillota bacterium]
MTEKQKTSELLTAVELEESLLYKKIAMLVIRLGIQPSYKGYKYLSGAIYLSVTQPDRFTAESLYNALSKIYNQTRDSIERGIRYCIQLAQYTDKPQLVLNDFFGSMVVGQNYSLTNLQFIAYVAEAVRFDM